MRSACDWTHDDWGLVLIALTAHADVLDAVPVGARHRAAELTRELAATARHEWATRSPLAPATTAPVDPVEREACGGDGLGIEPGVPCMGCRGEGVTEAAR